jgi:16S rRNA processing protein RimM
VFSYTDPSEQIFEYLPWQLVKGRKRQSLQVAQHQRQGKGLIALPEGYETRDQAELLAGWEIQIDQSRLPGLVDGEFYWHQLEGLRVVNLAGTVLGEVDHMLETGANDVLVVKPVADSIDTRERLIPYVEGRIVQRVDLLEGCIQVDWDTDF